MGWDIVSVGQHNLNISSLENLAKDLSERLDINIIYGGFEIVTYSKEKHKLSVHFKQDFTKFGRFIANDSDKIYHLVDDTHCYKEILNGLDDLESLTIDLKGNHYSSPKEIRNDFHRGYINYDLYTAGGTTDLYEIFGIDILEDTVLVVIKEPFRWFRFLDIFIKKIEEYRKEYFFEYRKKLKSIYNSLGVHQILFFADQGIGESILNKAWESNWKELNSFVKNKVYCQNSLSDEFAEKEIEDAIHFSISDFFLNKHPLYDDDAIDVLFDDFKDLE